MKLDRAGEADDIFVVMAQAVGMIATVNKAIENGGIRKYFRRMIVRFVRNCLILTGDMPLSSIAWIFCACYPTVRAVGYQYTDVFGIWIYGQSGLMVDYSRIIFNSQILNNFYGKRSRIIDVLDFEFRVYSRIETCD